MQLLQQCQNFTLSHRNQTKKCSNLKHLLFKAQVQVGAQASLTGPHFCCPLSEPNVSIARIQPGPCALILQAHPPRGLLLPSAACSQRPPSIQVGSVARHAPRRVPVHHALSARALKQPSQAAAEGLSKRQVEKLHSAPLALTGTT